MKSRTREAEQLLTRMVSCVGICPGPPPVFSGSKSDFGSHRKSGLSTYPQRPLGRKRPWFRSICSPGVWKFRATGQQREWSSLICLPCSGAHQPSCDYINPPTHTHSDDGWPQEPNTLALEWGEQSSHLRWLIKYIPPVTPLYWHNAILMTCVIVHHANTQAQAHTLAMLSFSFVKRIVMYCTGE